MEPQISPRARHMISTSLAISVPGLLVHSTHHSTERTHQTVEIATRFYISQGGTNWPDFLPTLHRPLNNSRSESAGISPNEPIHEFRLNESIPSLVASGELDLERAGAPSSLNVQPPTVQSTLTTSQAQQPCRPRRFCSLRVVLTRTSSTQKRRAFSKPAISSVKHL
ncbi:uncharacterized protein BDZ99DRAFT_469681 [Mytilinidion resinicola]|uniref:Uncharacterized protein n=1 Tax=Mytilinidion resinicola TaxID=574789 RepID=A0A6A6XY94_9PEZI|nr:uncharacterized protein BDZ99DRAFT_469681 [Mytilinidion resinicola]KAF2801349.1 hypothetical protein BDZ99DRAFT_469681 [Mytilinidion resinicola]